MKKFRVGIIGCGRISVVYLKAFLDIDDLAEVCFAVDKEIGRAEAFASHFEGCGFSDSLEDMLAVKPDAVHVCTPHFLHKEHVVACLKAGCHVLTEKPIALSMGDAREMIETAKNCRRQLGVIFQNRFIEGVQEAKRAFSGVSAAHGAALHGTGRPLIMNATGKAAGRKKGEAWSSTRQYIVLIWSGI